jgi:hypothetical protein
MTSINLSSSFFIAQKQNKKDDDERRGSSLFSTANEKKGDLREKCTCILANMISFIL